MITNLTIAIKLLKQSLLFIILLIFQDQAFSQDTSYRGFLDEVATAGDPLKVKAGQFLAKNIPGKVYHDGESLQKFDKLFEIMAELKKVKRIDNQDPRLRSAMDSLVEEYGNLMQLNVIAVEDSKTLTRDFLKEDLDQVFKVRAEKGWLRTIPDDIFLEYILPYRVGMERLEAHQRSALYNTYNFIKKSSRARQETFDQKKSTDLLKFASDVQYEISRKISTNGTMWEFPYDIPISKMELGGQGSCNHLVSYTTAAMRSVGIPVASDLCIRWGNNRTGHKWNVLFLENGEEIPFDAAQSTIGFDIKDRKVAKVYRERFSKVENLTPPSPEDVPQNLFNLYWEDVTKKYTKVADIKIKIPIKVRDKRSYVLIGTFNNTDWEPQFYAKIIDGEAVYERMGIDNIYIGMYKDGSELKTFGDPFTVDHSGKVTYLRSRGILKEQNILRKYPRSSWVKFYEGTMVDGMIQCISDQNSTANKFEYAIKNVPDSIVDIPVPKGLYRYIKYTFPDSPKVYIAELIPIKKGLTVPLKVSATENDKGLEKVIDMDLNSYYWGKKGQTITFDMGEDIPIDHLRFSPRSDSNFIIMNDEYELCYWNDNKWSSIGIQTATTSKLKFKNVPDGALFILHDLSGGKEERIFTIVNGAQIWW